jgi:hypothetical protein
MFGAAVDPAQSERRRDAVPCLLQWEQLQTCYVLPLDNAHFDVLPVVVGLSVARAMH